MKLINENHFIEAYNKMLDKLATWLDSVILNLPNIIIAITVFVLAIIASKYISKLVEKLLDRSSLQRSMKKLIAQAFSLITILLAMFLILGILNLSKALNTILAGAGVAGLAVGLALQSALANSYSGIVLSYIKDLKFGDWIKTNDFEGEVIDIDLRVTTIKQIDNNLVYIPNKLVSEQALKNFSKTKMSRVILTCGVAYKSDLEFVQRLVKETLTQHFDSVNKERDVLFLWREFGDSSINFETRFWIESSRPLLVAKAKSKAMIVIKKAFDENQISIPFPMRTLELPDNININTINSQQAMKVEQ
ncbi:mechanosensitive ion channel family protein [Aquimarina agarivorans]|uniref:mechanosensitive ion channel family protein n=1 Tax=Aquimarina agarivorans TaxID=980584 RepID=UPI000248F27F|nr:mechanosensitive ion channel family protein [Aquimarina agarivorans]